MQNVSRNGKFLSRKAANKRLEEQLRSLAILAEIYMEETKDVI